MSRGHHIESQSQVAAITSNIARGRDVLAALAAAWSSSLDAIAAEDNGAATPHTESHSDHQPNTRVTQ